MLRIDTQSETPDAVIYAVAGRLEREDLPELVALIDAARAAGRRVTFDLAEVGLVSREVVEFFARGAGRHIDIVRCPDYVREWVRCSRASGDRKPS